MELDVAGLGAFVDTTGSRKTPKASKRLKQSTQEPAEPEFDDEILYQSQAIPFYHDRDPVEEKLESLVFGTHPFHGPGDTESESEQDEERDSDHSDVDSRQRERDMCVSKKKAWHDEDDEDIRYTCGNSAE